VFLGKERFFNISDEPVAKASNTNVSRAMKIFTANFK
jgi:hypothetical protein